MELNLEAHYTKKQGVALDVFLNQQEKRYIIFGGGAGGGKTVAGCMIMLTMAYQFPGCRLFIGREELKRLTESVLVTWIKMCGEWGVPQEHWKYNGQKNFIELFNGSTISFLDLKLLPSDPMFERFGSTEYTAGWIEEAGEVDQMAFEVLKSRVGRHRNQEYGFPGKILITCNPKKNWLYTKGYKPFVNRSLPEDWAFIQSLYSDNIYTAEEYGRQLATLPPILRERLMYGNWDYDEDPAKLIEYDAICDLFFNRTEALNPQKYITLDIARYGRDRTVIMRWEGWQVKEIVVFAQSSIDALQEEVKEMCNKHGIPRSHVLADEVGVGGGFVDNFKSKGYVGNHSPIQIGAKKFNFGTLNDQCAFMLADKVNKREIGIDSEKWAEELKEELDQIRQKDLDKEGKLRIVSKDEVKKNIGRSPDFRDAMIMRMWFELNKPSVGTTMADYMVAATEDVTRLAQRVGQQDELGMSYKKMIEYQREALREATTASSGQDDGF